ncbi:MAG: hypothetical protein Q8S73_07140, partial [Deltaproteobacteria bacterium]|nr:hypothetical protein [Deltaproteobacteria bacterium]
DAPVAAAATTARAERRPDSLKDALDRSSSLRAGSIALRGDDGALVHIDGPVAVLAGSREVWTGCTLPRLPRAIRGRVEAADEAGAAMLSNQHVVLASVAAGDRVQAFGRLVARQDIRSVAVRWTLAPAPELAAGPDDAALAAVPMVYEAPGRVSGPMRRALARAALLGAAGSFAGAVLVGELANLASNGAVAASATVHSRAGEPLAFRSLSTDLVAAATPFRRDVAVRRVARQVRSEARGERDVRAVAALWSLGSDCHVGVQILAQRGRFDEAMTLGERCRDAAARWTTAQVAMLAGQPARASHAIDDLDAPPPGFLGQEVFGALAHLGAGRFALAAAMLRRAADQEGTRRGRGNDESEREQALRCAVAAVEVRAGRPEAKGELRARVRGRQGWRCALFLADVLEGSDRLATLRDARARLGRPYGVWTSLDALLRIEGGEALDGPPELLRVRADTLLMRPGQAFDGHIPALERSAYEALTRVPDAAVTPAVRIGRARLEVARAAFEIAFGSGEEARRLLAMALDSYAAAEPSGSEDQRDAVELGLALENRTGLPFPHDQRRLPDAGRFDPSALAHLGDLDSLGASMWGDERGRGLVPRSGEVDGYALADDLWRARDRDVFVDATVALGVRRLSSGVESMRAWLAWGPRAPCWRCQMRYAAADLSHVAITARVLGMREETAAAERAREAMRATMLRRDAGVATMLIESM